MYTSITISHRFHLALNVFVCADALHPSQHFIKSCWGFSGLIQYISSHSASNVLCLDYIGRTRNKHLRPQLTTSNELVYSLWHGFVVAFESLLKEDMKNDREMS